MMAYRLVAAVMSLGPPLGIALSLVLLALLLWGVKQPLAWIVVAFLFIAIGVGLAGYGCAQALLVSGPRTSQEVDVISQFIGAGVGGAVAGIVLLVVALLRCKKSPNPNA